MDTLDALATNVLQFFIVVIAGLMVLGRLGLDIGPAVAGLGVVGIAVGFGAQFLVRDYLNGALILIENQFGRATSSASPAWRARSRTSRLRRTTLRDLDGVVHTVPNGEIQVASNLTRVWSRINQDVTVAYGTDIDKAIEVVDDVGREMAGDPVWKRRVLEAPRVERVEALEPRRRHAQDPGHGPRRRPVGRRGRPAQAPARRLQGARHRDPAPARVVLTRDDNTRPGPRRPTTTTSPRTRTSAEARHRTAAAHGRRRYDGPSQPTTVQRRAP